MSGPAGRSGAARRASGGAQVPGRPPELDYRELFERAGDLIYTLDTEGRFTFVNPAFVRVLGYSRADEVVGRHFAQVLAPDSRDVAVDHFTRGVAGEDIPPFFEVEAVRPDGSTVHLEVRAGSLYHDGEVVGRQGIARDISELKALQAAVSEKSQRVALLEAQARAAMELYARVAQLTLDPTDPATAERTLQAVRSSVSAVTASNLGLSSTDLEIVRMLAQGCTNRQIAERVHLSPNTVKDHVGKLIARFGASNRAEVVAEAGRLGLLD